MSTMPRNQHLRQPPLRDVSPHVEELDCGIRVYSSVGYVVFIERMWHGDYQQIPVDPSDIPALIEALRTAAGVVS